MDKINRLANNLGIDKDFEAAVQAHLKKTGQLPADEPGEGEGAGADMASRTEEATGANPLEKFHKETAARPDFFGLNRS
jgi:hypothetical protein